MPNNSDVLGIALKKISTAAKPSTDRPTNIGVGYMMFDTTLGKPIWYKGESVWVDATGATV